MSAKRTKQGDGSINITIGEKAKVSDFAGRDKAGRDLSHGNTTNAESSAGISEILGRIEQALLAEASDAEEAKTLSGDLKSEIEKADKGDDVDEYRLSGILRRVAEVAPSAVQHIVGLFAPTYFAGLAKGAVKATLDALQSPD